MEIGILEFNSIFVLHKRFNSISEKLICFSRKNEEDLYAEGGIVLLRAELLRTLECRLVRQEKVLGLYGTDKSNRTDTATTQEITDRK